MVQATLTSKGQITIPREIREALALGRGDHVSFRLRPDGVVEMTRQSGSVLSLVGMLKPTVRGVTVEQMNEAIRREGGKP